MTRTAKGSQRRDEILDTALEVLAHRGYRQTSLRGIGRELGVQPAQLLHYFGSKEDLLESVIARWDAESEAVVVEGAAAGRDFLDAWPLIVQRNSRVAGLVHLYTALAAEAADENHPSRSFFAERWRRVREYIAADLERRVRDGRASPGLDPQRSASRLIAFSDGMQLQWLMDRSIDMVAELTAMVDAELWRE